MALKDWNHLKIFPDAWVRKDGVELNEWGFKQKYPFLSIDKNYYQFGKHKGYVVQRVGTNSQKILKIAKTKASALVFVKNYMKRH